MERVAQGMLRLTRLPPEEPFFESRRPNGRPKSVPFRKSNPIGKLIELYLDMSSDLLQIRLGGMYSVPQYNHFFHGTLLKY